MSETINNGRTEHTHSIITTWPHRPKRKGTWVSHDVMTADMYDITNINPEGNQSWILTGRTDAEAPILWPPDAKNWVIWKDPDAGKDWVQEEKGTTEDEMVGWHHRLDGHEFEQASGDGEGPGSLVCCSPWVSKSRTWLSDWTELN